MEALGEPESLFRGNQSSHFHAGAPPVAAAPRRRMWFCGRFLSAWSRASVLACLFPFTSSPSSRSRHWLTLLGRVFEVVRPANLVQRVQTRKKKEFKMCLFQSLEETFTLSQLFHLSRATDTAFLYGVFLRTQAHKKNRISKCFFFFFWILGKLLLCHNSFTFSCYKHWFDLSWCVFVAVCGTYLPRVQTHKKIKVFKMFLFYNLRENNVVIYFLLQNGFHKDCSWSERLHCVSSDA